MNYQLQTSNPVPKRIITTHKPRPTLEPCCVGQRVLYTEEKDTGSSRPSNGYLGGGGRGLTLNPQPSTLNPELLALNSEPSTLNPEPWTLDPEP